MKKAFLLIFLLVPHLVGATLIESNGTNSLSGDITLSGGLNRILVVDVQWENDGVNTDTIDTVYYDGIPYTSAFPLVSNGTTGTQYEQQFIWLEADLPSDGSHTLEATVISSGGSIQGQRMQATLYEDMAQEIPSGDQVVQVEDTNGDVEVISEGSTVHLGGTNNQAGTANTPLGAMTELWDVDRGDQRALGIYQDELSIGTFNAGYTGGTDRPATSILVFASFGGVIPPQPVATSTIAYEDWIFVNSVQIGLLAFLALGFLFSPWK